MELASKDSCTGCGNCRLVCKKKAVTFTRDALNNIYPVIDSSKCVECGLCQKACPAINQVEKITPKQCYSCYATNKAIRKSSASGGVAQAIYRWCLKSDIPFAGVYFDNKELTAKYKLGFSEEDIHQFTNSKYTFSFMGNISEDIADILKNGKPLVFIGLPCQVAAVKNMQKKKKSTRRICLQSISFVMVCLLIFTLKSMLKTYAMGGLKLTDYHLEMNAS